MADNPLEALDAEFEAGLGQASRPRAASPAPDLNTLDAEFEAGLKAAPRRPARPAPAPAPEPVGRTAPRLPFVTTAPNQPRPEEALFTPTPAPTPKPKPRPQPKPVKIPTIQPLNLGGQTPDEASYVMAQRQYKSLPEFAKNPNYRPVPGGKVAQILETRSAAIQRLSQNRGKLEGELDQWAATFNKDQQRLNQAVQKINQRGASPAEKKAIEQAQRTIDQNWSRLHQRAKVFKNYWNEAPRVTARVKNIPLHEGPYLPGEKEEMEASPLRSAARAVGNIKLFGHKLGEIVDPRAFTAPKLEKRDQIREQLKRTGEYPATPLIKGNTPQERAEKRRQLMQVRSLFFFHSPTEGLVPVQDVGEQNWRHRYQAMAPGLTPYQKSLLPIFQRQWQAEQKASLKAGVPGAMVADVGLGVITELTGGPAGQAAVRAAEKRLAPAAVRALAKAKIPKWAGEKAVKLATEAGAGAAVGAAQGAVATGAPTYVETRDIRKTVQAAKQGARVGAMFGAGGAVLHQGLEAGAEGQAKAKGKAVQRQAAREMAAATPGPKAKTAGGVEVRLRHTDAQALERIRGEYELQRQAGTLTPEAAQHEAQIRQWQETQARRQAQLHTELPPEELGTYHKEWTNPKNPAKAQRDQMLAQAEHLAETNPRLSELLAKEADEIQGEFIHDYLKKSNRVDVETPNPEIPTSVSTWRQLSPEEQAKLPGQLRQTLLMRDIQNSVHVLDPAADSVYLPKDIGVKSLADLEAKADSLFVDAQAHLDERFQPAAAEAPAPEVAAPVSQQISPKRKRAVAPQPEPVAEMPTEAPLAPVQATEPKVDVTAPIERAPVPEGPGEALPPREKTHASKTKSPASKYKAELKAAARNAPAPVPMDPAVLMDPSKRGEPGYYIKAEEIAPDLVGHNPHTGEIVRVLERDSEPGHWRVLVTTSGSQRGKGPISTVGDVRTILGTDLANDFLTVEKAPQAAGSTAPREITTEFKPTHVNEAGKQVEFIRDEGRQVRVRDSGEYGQQFNIPKQFFEKTYKAIEEAPAPKDVTLNTGRADLSANPKSGEFKTVQRKTADGTVVTHTEGMAKGLENHPRAHELNAWVEGNAAKLGGVIERVVKKVLPAEEAARVRHAGVGLLEWGGQPAFGANLHNAGEPGGPTEILVGPFRTEEPVTSRTWYNQPSGGDNPRKVAAEVVYTSLHEAAHNLVREEGQPLWSVMDKLWSKAGDDFFERAIQEVTDVFTGGKEGGDLSPEYLAARQVYLEVARGAGSARRADGAGAAVGARSAAGASLSRGVPGGERGVRPARGRNRGVDTESLIQDPVLHERYQANRVPTPESFKEKHLPTFERFWHGLTRTIPELPNKPEFAPLRNLFREFRSLDDIAAAKRTFVIQKELSGLSKPEYERLGEAVFLRNMAANVKRQKAAFIEKNGNLNGFEARLPREWTETALNDAMKRADDLFQNNPKIKSAYDGLDAARAEITTELKSLYKAVTGRELKLDLEDYHHQAIIAYARGKAEGGSKTGGKPGFMKQRLTEGHDLEYYTDFIEHESRWLESAVRKTQTLKLWKTLLDDYDISKEVSVRAKTLNDKAFLPSLQKLAGGTMDPATIQKLAKLAAEDGLPDHVDARFSDLLDGLEDLEKNGTPLSPEMEAQLPAYGKFLISRPKGQGLGWKPGELVPEGYVKRSVDEISNIFAANAVSQKIAQEAQLLAGSVVGISADDLKKVMALGRRKEIIIPKEVGEALDRWQARPADEWERGVSRGIRKTLGIWKAEKLINPLRGAAYWIGNAVSDFDALFQGNPRALKRVPAAAKEVAGFLAGKRPSKNLRVWIEKGGLSGLLTGQEGIGTGVFGADPLGKFSPRKSGGIGKAWDTTLALARLPHDWREATGRFAAFEEFLDQIERDIKSGGAGVPENWGASNPAEVMALKDKHDRAYKLANDLVGNYDEITAAGRYVRAHIIPFYSWCVPVTTEILTREGWKTHDQVEVDDEVLTYNMETHVTEWQPLQRKTILDYDGDLVTLSNTWGVKYQFTPDHRVPVIEPYKGRQKIVLAKDLKTHHQIPLVAPHAFEGESVLTAEEAALLGWIVTDGYFRWHKNSLEAMIYQSPKKHAVALRERFADYISGESVHPQTGVICFRLKSGSLSAIKRVFCSKADLPSIVTRLDRSAAEAMYQAMLDGEGTVRPDFTAFPQQKGPVLDAFQILCYRLGKLANIRTQGGQAESQGLVYVRQRDRMVVFKWARTNEYYKGQVWCPTTANGTWIMRQNGAVMITGNCEVNTRRQLRLYKNAWDSPKIAAAYGKKVAGGPVPVTQAIALGRFALKAATLSLMIDAANETFFPEERRELGDKKRGRPVLIVGRDEKGRVMTYDRLGNLPELMSWFGLDNHGFSPAAAVKGGSLKAGAVGGYAEAWLNGRMTIGEVGQDMANQFVNKLGGGMGPYKVPFEIMTGKNLMEVTDPSPNINRWDPLYQSIGFGLPALQRNLEGRPLRPGQGKVLDRPLLTLALGYKTVDLSEEAYNEMRGYAHEWLAKKGKARAMAVPTSEKGIALYWHKKALKYGDTATAALKLREYAQGATEDDYVASLKKLSPLSAMSDAEKKEFVNSLAADDLARLRRAYLHYQDLVAPEITARAARLERIIDRERPADSSLTPLEWQRKRTYLWIQRLAEGRGKQVKGMIERYLERHNPLKELAKDDRGLRRQLRKNERARRMQRRGR